MKNINLKYLFRSRSFKFMMNKNTRSKNLEKYTWNKNPVYYRASTSDMTLIYEVLLKSGYKSEYYLPENFNPKVILDIGANIGITSIYLTKKFPNSKIFSFEPLLENYDILKKNTENYKNIKVFNFGLGKKDETLDIYLSDDSENFGGGSFFPEVGGTSNRKVKCEIKNIQDTLVELDMKEVDLIKIDTEGAEFDILTSLNKKYLKSVKWITGELHGYKDFELLDYLQGFGFNIGIKKQINNRLFMFHAINNKTLETLNKQDIKRLVKWKLVPSHLSKMDKY